MRGVLVATVVCGSLMLAGCGDDDTGAASPAEGSDGVEAAQERATAAEDAVAEAQSALDESTEVFCESSEAYVTAVDRYGQAFSETAATVGDITTAGADLAEPREAVRADADDVATASDDLAAAEEELAEARRALAEAQSSTTTTPATTTTTAPLVPATTVDRVERAETEFAAAAEGITEETPLTEATAQLNAAAFAVEVTWLRLFADAGCLTSEQHEQAVAAVVDYTTALQTSLHTAGYYDGEIDGIYGPDTVDAVEALQTDNDLPVTGLVDRATAAALDAAVGASGDQAATDALTHTAAVQSTLKLAGYWTGAIDGQWTPELTTALETFQADLGVEPTGAVDAATLHALEQNIAEAQAPPTTTTSTVAATTTSPP